MPSVVKQLMLEEVEKQFDKNPYVVFSSFEKITVADITDFRRALEKVSKRSVLLKHAMAKKIFEKKQWASADAFLKGSVIASFAETEPQDLSRAIAEFSKDHKEIEPVGMIFENKTYDAAFVKTLAKLPSKKDLLTQVVVRIKSPISGLVLTLGQMTRGLVVALNEIKKQKEAQGASA